MIKQNVLDVLNLCKSYGNHLVLDDISFSIRENEIVGFIGPNGAGKSTLMKCLCGLIHMILEMLLYVVMIYKVKERRLCRIRQV